MILPQRLTVMNTPDLTPGLLALCGTTKKIAIDRTWPIEEILVIVHATAGAAAADATLTLDGLLGALKRVNLSINDGVQPRTIVDCRGVALLEYAEQVGLGLDRATAFAVSEHNKSSGNWGTSARDLTNDMKYRITYRIPLVHPMACEPLRTQMLLDVNHHMQDPVLTLDFASTSEIYSAGTALAVVGAEVVLVRRAITPEQDKAVMAKGGFIAFDLIETPFTIGTGVSGEQRWQIPSPGYYAGLLMRLYKGGAAVTRDDFSENTTPGTETKWRLESGGVVLRDWRLKHAQIINDFSRTLNSLAQESAGAASVGSLPAAATGWQSPASVYLDFLSDGLGDSANELGSLLDCNIPQSSGLRMELIASVASVATNASTLYIMGHRYFGDLNKWRSFKI